MKLAVGGKGGVGKTTLVSLLANAFKARGREVIVVDADPDPNLAGALGFTDTDKITPVAEMKELIEERTGATPGQFGSFFKMNPQVEDLPDELSLKKDGIRLLVMGTVKGGGSGCVCPESVLLKTLITHLVLQRDEVIIMDMEAGVEHLGRGTSQAVDRLLIVVEPGRRAFETAEKIMKLGADIGLKKVSIVGNKIRKDSDREFIRENAKSIEILGFLPFSEEVIEADMKGLPAADADERLKKAAAEIADILITETDK